MKSTAPGQVPAAGLHENGNAPCGSITAGHTWTGYELVLHHGLIHTGCTASQIAEFSSPSTLSHHRKNQKSTEKQMLNAPTEIQKPDHCGLKTMSTLDCSITDISLIKHTSM
jgi:hypothetical protein